MSGRRLLIQIVRTDCIGDGACCDTAPRTFQMDREGIATIRTDGRDDDETVIRAAWACPLDAIVVTDEETGKQLVPEE